MKLGNNDITIKLGSVDVNSIYLGTQLVYSGGSEPPTPIDYENEYLTFVALESGTFKFSGNSINYSLDSGTTWTQLASNTDSPSVSQGQKIMWKLSGVTPAPYSSIGSFSSTGNFTVEGNIMSLVYGDNFSGQTTIPSGMFYAIFNGCTTLTSAENLVLPSTTLSDYCYMAMFMGCTSLTSAPILSATTLAEGCCWSMFEGCTALSNITCLATNISATQCTYNWVNGVASSGTFTKAASMTSWTSGVNGIPTNWTVEDYHNPTPTPPAHDYSRDYLTFTATESGKFKFSGNSVSYSLYRGSTWTALASNTNSPTVSAGNKILWKASNLTLSNYGIGKFISTGTFTVEGNVMSLISGDSFVNATTISELQFAYLFNGTSVTSAENLVLPSTTLAPNCYYSMFTSCSGLTSAPQILATTLANNCCYGMFIGCTSLTSAPILSATTLVSNCYRYMFQNCSSLNSITCLATDISANGCTSYWVDGVQTTSGTFTKAASMTSWTRGRNGIPNNWTVEDYQT